MTHCAELGVAHPRVCLSTFVRLNYPGPERRRVGVDGCDRLIVGHHDVDGRAVLAAVQASVLRTDRSAAAGLDRVCAQRTAGAYVMADKDIPRLRISRRVAADSGRGTPFYSGCMRQAPGLIRGHPKPQHVETRKR